MLAVLFFGIVPAVMPGRLLMSAHRDRLARERSDPHLWSFVYVEGEVTLLDGSRATGGLMTRIVDGERWYRHLTSQERGQAMLDATDV